MSAFLLKVKYLFYLFIVGKFFKFPYHCHFQVTRRCNFRCESCCVWKGDGGQKELSLEEVKEAASQLKKIGVQSVVLTGGEPLLREDIASIIGIFKSKNFIVRLQTNGFLLTESLLGKMLSQGLDDIYISFDSLKPASFSQINGVVQPRVFEEVCNNIKACARIVKEYRTGMFLLTVVRPSNIGEIESLYSFAKELGCLIAFYGLEIVRNVHPSSIRSVDQNLVPTSQDRQNLKEAYVKIKVLKNEKDSRVFMSERLLNDYIEFYGHDNSGMRWPCHAGERYLELLSDGSVAVCNGCAPIKGYHYKNLLDLYKSKDKSRIFQACIDKCEGCICTRQLEYLMDDVSDLFKKTTQYLRTIFWK